MWYAALAYAFQSPPDNMKACIGVAMGHGVFSYAFCQAFSKAHPSSDEANYNVYQTIACPIARGFFGLAFLLHQPSLKLPEI
jgi:hypothetical protein